jgi:hypothetical protein
MARLTNEEYEALAMNAEEIPPKLSGKAGYMSQLRERALVSELLSSEYARIVCVKANVMSISPAEVIQQALKNQFAEN